VKCRYYAAGEYGEQLSRPHYHLLLFGYWPEDTVPLKKQKGYQYYWSQRLHKLWGKGAIDFSAVTRSNCEYVARYVMKKIVGKDQQAYDHYERIAPDGAIYYLPPEFAVMSRRPGIGTAWIEEFWEETYHSDSIVLDGREKPVPQFYDKWLAKHHPDEWEEVRQKRVEFAKQEHVWDNRTPARLQVRETVAKARNNQRTRSYEEAK
jgi:hypothetical protein